MKRRPFQQQQLIYIYIYIYINIGAFVKKYRDMKELLVQKSKKKNVEKSFKILEWFVKKSLESSNPFLVSLYQISKL